VIPDVEALLKQHESRFEAAERRRDESIDKLSIKIDKLTDALTGDELHPNGLVTVVKGLEVAFSALEAKFLALAGEWKSFKESGKSFGRGAVFGMALVSGGLGAGIAKLFG
jgi:hypothetical protein